MTIRTHLLFSSLIHAVLVAYLVSIPIYRGSLSSISLRPYLVDLVTFGKSEIPSPILKTAVRQRPQINVAQYSEGRQDEAQEPETIAAAKNVSTPPMPVGEAEDQNETIPEGITVIPDEPKKSQPKEDTMIAHAEVPMIENKPAKELNLEPETKPAPPKVEPVISSPPQRKSTPEIIIKELTLPKEPVPAEPPAPKLSKVDSTERPAREEFPVIADEKAEDVLPSVKTEKTAEAKTPDLLLKTSESKKEAEVVKETKASTHPVRTPLGTFARAEKGETTGSKKPEKQTEQKSGGKTSGQSPTRKSGIAFRPSRSAVADTSARDARSGGDNRSRGDSTIEQGTEQTAAVIPPNAETPREELQQKPPFGIAVSDALFHRDIKIEVSLTKEHLAGITSTLHRRPHPSIAEYGRSEQKLVELSAESETTGKTVFFIDRAEKGLYTFAIENTGENEKKTSVIVHLLEGKKGARNRKFETVDLHPHSRFAVKFILPEAIFWDDESYFTGIIESSDSVTKFNDTTGIVWKEEKEE